MSAVRKEGMRQSAPHPAETHGDNGQGVVYRGGARKTSKGHSHQEMEDSGVKGHFSGASKIGELQGLCRPGVPGEPFPIQGWQGLEAGAGTIPREGGCGPRPPSAGEEPL